ncbi:MAG: TIGR02221 family CRISPR-associated protein [Arthrospira sp. SH-MAG29]|nr:TIGR02221 family CRISPR-associated protein [Arthrospira sp. SH-MAG29]MBS0017742.1 TIGR02221 family CRISPR-associated protein [Arthrospira sp. SH-MAG29]
MAQIKAISFLGYNPRGYTQTTYVDTINNSRCTTPFFQEALVEFYQPDILYVLLTKTAEIGQPQGESQPTWDTLQQLLQGKVDLKPIKNIPEKHTEADIWLLFEKITDCLEEGDHVIFDITHGFRSLPVLALIAVSYLRVVRNITIKGLIYGAFDPTKPGETSIFDLLPIVSLLEWTTATDQFIKTGNGQQLATLLKQAIPSGHELANIPETRPIRKHLQKSAEATENVSLALSLTRPIETMESATVLENILNEARPSFDKRAKPFTLLVDKIIEEYGQFALEKATNREMYSRNLWLQLKMIYWYLERDQIVQAVTLAREWLVSVLVIHFDEPMLDKKGRKHIENALNNGVEQRKPKPRPITPSNYDEQFDNLSQADELTIIWSKMTEIRNDIAHVGMNLNPSKANSLKNSAISMYPSLEEIAKQLLPSS